MIYGGMDEFDNHISTIDLLDLRSNIWYSTFSHGEEPSLRDSQSCSMINNTCYIFGGQGLADVRFNDLYTLSFEINETEKKFVVVWNREHTTGTPPPERTSHSSTPYKNQFIVIIGGEGENQGNFAYILK